MNETEKIKSAKLAFKTAIELKKGTIPIQYNLDVEDAKLLLNYIENLEQANKQLKERIDKATNKLKSLDELVDIENNMYVRMTYITKFNNTIKILEGESNE